MSAKITCICDACGEQATLEGFVARPGGLPPGAVINLLPPGWDHTVIAKPPYVLHACKPACKAVVELKYLMEPNS